MDKKYTDDSSIGAISGTEEMPIAQSGVDLKVTPNQLLSFILTGYIGANTIVTVGTITTGTWNAAIKPRVQSAASTATLNINADAIDFAALTALATPLTIVNPTGTPSNGQKITIRLKDNGTNRSLTFGSKYRFSIGLAAPTSTVAGETLYMEFIYNAADDKWDCIWALGAF